MSMWYIPCASNSVSKQVWASFAACSDHCLVCQQALNLDPRATAGVFARGSRLGVVVLLWCGQRVSPGSCQGRRGCHNAFGKWGASFALLRRKRILLCEWALRLRSQGVLESRPRTAVFTCRCAAWVWRRAVTFRLNPACMCVRGGGRGCWSVLGW